MKEPTCEDLWEGEGFEGVFDEVVDTWRWGVVKEQVFRRESDNTYWSVCYRLSSDGDTNEFRDGDADVEQVKPVERKVMAWVGVDEAG